jgi:hypothetical protein
MGPISNHLNKMAIQNPKEFGWRGGGGMAEKTDFILTKKLKKKLITFFTQICIFQKWQRNHSLWLFIIPRKGEQSLPTFRGTL